MRRPHQEPVSCPYCAFGLTPAVKELYKRMDFDPDEYHHEGGGHIVFADENYEDRNIQWCLDNGATGRAAAVLRALLEIPENERTWDELPEEQEKER